MKKALILSRSSKFKSNKLRSLIYDLREQGYNIYTDKDSDLVIRETLAYSMYPNIIPEDEDLTNNYEIYIVAKAVTDSISEICTNLDELKIDYKLILKI